MKTPMGKAMPPGPIPPILSGSVTPGKSPTLSQINDLETSEDRLEPPILINGILHRINRLVLGLLIGFRPFWMV